MKHIKTVVVLKYVWLVLYIVCSSANSNAQEVLINDLKIEGNKRLKTSFVKRIVMVKEGSRLDSLILESDILRLKRLPSVAHAKYKVIKKEANNWNVIYHIEENFTLIPSLNIYTTDDDEFAFRIGLAEFNFLGQNIELAGFYQHDIFDSHALRFKAPYLFSRQLGVALNYQNLTTQEPVFFNDTSANYRYNNESVELLGLYEINFKNRFELGLNYFSEDYQYKSGATSPSIPQIYRINKWLVKGIYEFNNLDYFYQYISGFRSQLHLQYVTPISSPQSDFFIAWNDFFYFKRFGNRGNWANRVRLGLSTNNESPFAPFSVDNNINIRGVGNTIDRGTGVVVINTEYRHTLIEKDWFVLQGNTFVDAGTWRNPGGDFGDFTDMGNIKIYPGIGFRFIHKRVFNAIFRIDYGYGITKNATKGLVFGIGQYF